MATSPAKKAPAPTKAAPPAKKAAPPAPARGPAPTPGKGITANDPKKNALSAAINFEAESGAGLSNTDQDSFALPFLTILQSNSPQCTRGDEAYIKGAKPGDLFLTANGIVMPFGDEEQNPAIAQVVFCNFKRRFLRWAPRDAGGGFKGEYRVEQIEEMRAAGQVNEQDNKLYDEGGDIYRDTRIHYVIVRTPDGEYFPAVMSLTSTQIKKSKALLTQLQSYLFEGTNGRKFNPPTYAHVFDVGSRPESNDQGNWHGWTFTRAGNVEDAELYEMAKQFFKTTNAGLANVDFAKAGGEAPASNEGGW